MADISSPPPLTDAERGPSPVDLAVLALMVALGCLGILLAHDYADEGFTSRLVPWADYVAFVVLILPIAWRRRAPASTDRPGRADPPC